jgi:zinc protease
MRNEGGQNNADTEQTITQYFATVPAAYLNVALQAQAVCLRGVDDSQNEWEQERGAIEQEVSRDLSNPTYKFVSRLNKAIFAGTPYAHDPLGTKDSFDATTGAMLKDFYGKWYSPSNAVLVVVGDIDPKATLVQITQLFGDIPRHAIPVRPTVELKPVKTDSFTLDSNLPYVLAFVAYRLPVTDSPDYAAAQILSDVLSSQRADLYAMVPDGKAVAAEFGLAETYPRASVGFGLVAQPAGVDAAASLNQMRQIIAKYAANGVPADLVEAARRSEIAQAEFQRNSIPGLANVWSNALAAEGRKSPEEDVEAIRKALRRPTSATPLASSARRSPLRRRQKSPAAQCGDCQRLRWAEHHTEVQRYERDRCIGLLTDDNQAWLVLTTSVSNLR